MQGSLALVVGLAIFSSLVFAFFSGAMSGSAEQGRIIMALAILYPINLIGSYLGSRNLVRQVRDANFKKLSLLWLAQSAVITLIAGFYPFLLLATAGLTYVGFKQQSA